MLDAQARALLELIDSLGMDPMNEMTVADARNGYRERRHATQPDAPEVAAVQEHVVPVPPSGSSIGVRSFKPKTSRASRSSAGQAALPALLYLHGGGWTIGDLDTHDTLCRMLCNESGCQVFSVDYRMGPEHKFPVAVEDSLAAWQWLHDNAQHLGVDPGRIAVGGDSAGGNLAAVLCLCARDGLWPQPRFQLLIYPAVDQRARHDSHDRNGNGYLLTRELMTWFRKQYHNNEAEYLDWRASPLLAQTHQSLPPALVLTAGFDPLVDEGQAYGQALRAAGVAVEMVSYPGQIHGFITMGRMIDQANEAVSKCAQALRQAMTASN